MAISDKSRLEAFAAFTALECISHLERLPPGLSGRLLSLHLNADLRDFHKIVNFRYWCQKPLLLRFILSLLKS
jgi:hypothetical protein